MPRVTPFSLQERKAIEAAIKLGISSAVIAKQIGRGKNSVVVELRRSGGKESYNALEAHEASKKRRVNQYAHLRELHKKDPNRLPNFYAKLNDRIECLEMQIEILTETIREITNGKNK